MPQAMPSLKGYALLALVVLLARGALALFPVEGAFAAQAAALSWPVLLAVVVLGYFGLAAASRAGIPAFLSPDVSGRERTVWPALAGALAGLAAIGWDLFFVLPRDLNVPFPQSIPFYLAGGFFVEVVQHLLPIVVLVWVLSRLLARLVSQGSVFWAVAVLVAALEPASQFGSNLFAGYPASFFVMGIALTYAINLGQLYLMRRRGFMATLIFRWSFYLLWHVLWGTLRLQILFG